MPATWKRKYLVRQDWTRCDILESRAVTSKLMLMHSWMRAIIFANYYRCCICVCVYDRRLVHVKPLFKMCECTSLHCFLHWLFIVNAWLCLRFWREIFNFDIYMVNLYAHSPLGGGSAQWGEKNALCFCDTFTWYPDNYNSFFFCHPFLLKMCQVTFFNRSPVNGRASKRGTNDCLHSPSHLWPV